MQPAGDIRLVILAYLIDDLFSDIPEPDRNKAVSAALHHLTHFDVAIDHSHVRVVMREPSKTMLIHALRRVGIGVSRIGELLQLSQPSVSYHLSKEVPDLETWRSPYIMRLELFELQKRSPNTIIPALAPRRKTRSDKKPKTKGVSENLFTDKNL